MKTIWASPNPTIKIRIVNTTVKPVLLYGPKTWRAMAAILKKIQTFINTCLRRSFAMARGHQQQRTLDTDHATTSRRLNPPKTLEADWTQSPKANDLYHTPSLDLEPTGKEKARPPKNT